MDEKELKENKIKRSKGFTLIELLAVIVVLAIVLVVTIPSVLSSMKDARSKQFGNAVASAKEWFEKQYDAAKLGEEYASNEFKAYLDEVCKDEPDDKKAECRKLTEYTQLTPEVIKAAGLNTDDFIAQSSFVIFSDNGKADIDLSPTSNGKFSDNYNLFDLSNRTEFIYSNPGNSTIAAQNITLSKDKYYYPVAHGGSAVYSGKINEVQVKAHYIKYTSNNGNADSIRKAYGVLVPLELTSGTKYKFSSNIKKSDCTVKIINYSADYSATILAFTQKTGEFSAEFTAGSGITAIAFAGADTSFNAEFTDIKLVKVSN